MIMYMYVYIRTHITAGKFKLKTPRGFIFNFKQNYQEYI